MTMVTAERMDSLATSENQAARGVRIYRQRRRAIQGFLPIFGTWHHFHPNTSTHFQDIMKSMQCLRSCGTSNTCTSSILPGSSHLVFMPQKAATSDQGQKQKQLMSNADVCVFIGKIITGVFQSFNARSGICFWWPIVRVQGQV